MKAKNRRTFSGTVEVCCHEVSFWYDVGSRRLTDEFKEALEFEACGRAKDLICEGFFAGELNCLWRGEAEIRGWWEIKH